MDITQGWNVIGSGAETRMDLDCNHPQQAILVSDVPRCPIQVLIPQVLIVLMS
jgi:hypothetical protein